MTKQKSLSLVLYDRFDFKMGENQLHICKEFKYLGTVLLRIGSLTKPKRNVICRTWA